MKYHSSIYCMYHGQGINNLKEKDINKLSNSCQDMISEVVTREKRTYNVKGNAGSAGIPKCNLKWIFKRLQKSVAFSRTTRNISDPFPRAFTLTESLFHHLSSQFRTH